MAVLNPSLFVETAHVFVDVETKGELTCGQTVADWKGHWGREPQTTILMEIDAQRGATQCHFLTFNRSVFPYLYLPLSHL